MEVTMKNKQTAVEWFMEQIGEKQPNGLYVIDTLEDVENVFTKAKEMEKERELNAYANGQADSLLMFKQKISKMKDIPTEFNQIISENFWDLI